MKKILYYASKQWKFYLISGISMAISIILAALGPRYIQQIVDTCIVGGNNSLFFSLAIPMVLTFVFQGLFSYCFEYFADRISGRVQLEMRKDVFSSIVKQDLSFFNSNNPGELMSRTRQDVENVGFAMGFIAMFAMHITFHVVHIVICIIEIDFLGALSALMIMPIIAVLAIISEPRGDKLSSKRSDIIADMNQTATESLAGIRTVKAFGRERYEARRFNKHNSLFRSFSQKIDYLWTDWGTPMSVLSRVMLALSIVISGVLVIKNRMTLGELTAVTSYTAELAWPMMELGWILAEFSNAAASSKKFFNIIDRKPALKNGEKKLSKLTGDLKFENVSYYADGKCILDNISFHLKEGHSLGIMGATGSGKTLITSLAMRFIDPTSGKITTEGVDLRDLSLDDVRGSKAIVTQDIFLFSNTIKANLEIGQKGQLSNDDLMRCAIQAHADDFIEGLTNGYETEIGEKGVGLSGGQKQRVTLARAFASNRPMLILDDATSALDLETEKKIQKSIRENNTSSLMIIGHRISSVKNADEIIVLENGRIAERGTHEELLEKKGLYYETYSIQYPTTKGLEDLDTNSQETVI